MKCEISKRIDVCEMREKGKTYTQIANKFGLSVSYVEHICREGAAVPPDGYSPKPLLKPYLRNGMLIRPFTDYEDTQILTLRSEGVANAKIGKKIGRSYSSVRNRLITLCLHEEFGGKHV